jgi:hypothetical protein
MHCCAQQHKKLVARQCPKDRSCFGSTCGRGGSRAMSQTGPRIVIDGYSYDVAAFKAVHPGGSVMNFYDNQDASEAFEAFHFRSEKVRTASVFVMLGVARV